MKKPLFECFSFLILLSLFNSSAIAQKTETALLAGGCFWCIESDFEKLDVVLEVVSGYTGGDLENPTYKQVSSGQSGHIEAALITYNPDKISYSEILDYFWRHIDPTTDQGQFCDFGPQYRAAIFIQNPKQKKLAEASLEKIKQTKPFKDPIKVELIEASEFYPAEDYHQDYYKKNPLRYKFYRYSCGRDKRVRELWGEEVQTH